MMIKQLTPITDVQWLSVTDTVRDALDHMETYEVSAVPLLDWAGRYVGTVTRADLRRHLANTRDERTPLGDIERRVSNAPVRLGEEEVTQGEHAFVPVVDDAGKLLGIVDRRRTAPHAA